MNVRKRYKLPIARKGEYPNGNLIQVIDDESLDAIVRNTMGSLQKTGKVLADFDHYSELSSDIKKALDGLGVQLPTMASGWISNVYREGDAVYGDMVSTPEGEKAIETETYCKTSPTFRLIDCSYIGQRYGKRLVRPLKVKSVALCNKPNMENLGAILKNREVIENKEDDLQSVMIGSLSMDILKKEKETMSETKDETIVTNAVAPVAIEEKPVEDKKNDATDAVEDSKAEAVVNVVESVATAVSETFTEATQEEVQSVIDATATATQEAVEAVAEVAVEAPATPADPSELDKANARIKELEAKLNELQALLDAEGTKRQEAELQNRIASELAKYPTLQNRAESEALLKLDWDLGVKFLASLPQSLPSVSKTIQNRVPAKTPEMDMEKMNSHDRIKAKMFRR